MKENLLPDFANSLYERFDRGGIPLLLAGGWAVCYHGYSRMTLDIDWVCMRSREAAAIALMDLLGFDKTTEGMASRFKRRGDPGFPYIDLIWVDDSTFAKMAAPDSDAREKPHVPVINFRALLAMKLHALKDDEVRRSKDLLDLRYLLSDSPIEISDEEFRTMCERFAGPDAYDKVKRIS